MVRSFFGEGARSGGEFLTRQGIIGGRGGRGCSTTVGMLTSSSHSAAVSVLFNDGMDFVLECSISKQVVVENFSFLLMSFQFFFELGDRM